MKTSDNKFSFLERFGESILSGGVAAVPFALFRYQKELGLSPEETWFVAYVLSFKWDGSLPYPSLRKMERLTGVPRRRLHRIKDRLIKKGYLQIRNQFRENGGQDRNRYDFFGLFNKLKWHIEQDENPGNPIAEDYTPGDKMTPAPGAKKTPPGGQNDTGPGVRNDTPKEEEIKEEEDNITTTLTGEEQEFLSLINSVENYPFDKKKDLVFLRNLKELFPTIDVLIETRKWAIYKQDKPLTKKSNPRSQLRNWLEIASKKQEGGKQNGGRIKPVAKPSATFDDWL